jgi:hypothetical protein
MIYPMEGGLDYGKFKHSNRTNKEITYAIATAYIPLFRGSSCVRLTGKPDYTGS